MQFKARKSIRLPCNRHNRLNTPIKQSTTNIKIKRWKKRYIVEPNSDESENCAGLKLLESSFKGHSIKFVV